MKLVHTSDIRLGAGLSGLKLAGDKIRAGLKAALAHIVDYALNEKADLVIIAGNLFDNHEISKNLHDFAATQLRRLNPIPVVVLPGNRDNIGDTSFWRTWEGIRLPTNIILLSDKKRPFVKIPSLDCTIYGAASANLDENQLSQRRLGQLQNSKHHIAVICGNMADLGGGDAAAELLSKYDYVALGGQSAFMDLSCPNYRAAFCGAPELLGFDETGAGNLALIQLEEPKNAIVSRVPFGQFQWKQVEYRAKEIANSEELLQKIREQAGPNVFLKAKLSGLALFEAALDQQMVLNQTQDEFAYLDIIDEMIVFPDDVVEVKASEKTILGQYLRLISQRLQAADDVHKGHLEKSIKIGYSLLSGREPWIG
jgi:DNA repair exonuclease SbcCD nuclease subunit